MLKMPSLFFCVLLVMYPVVSKSALGPSLETHSDYRVISTGLTKAIANLKRQAQNIMDMAFTKLGSRSIYIEQHRKTDWFSAEETCSEMGGHLITIQNEEEMSAITKHLHIKENENYWVGIITDLSCSGVYFPLVTGDNDPYFKWGPSAPRNLEGCEFCVNIYQSYMWDNHCANQYYFICEH